MKRKMFLAMIIPALFFAASCEKEDSGIDTGVSMTVTYPADAAGDLTVKISTESDFSVDTATKSFTVDGSGAAYTTLAKEFVIELAAGDYYARVFIDEDSDGTIDKGEYANAYDAVVYNATPTAITVSDGSVASQALTLDRQAGYCQVSGTIRSFDHPAGTLKYVFNGSDVLAGPGGGSIPIYSTVTYDVSITANAGNYISVPGGDPIPMMSQTDFMVNLDPSFTWTLKVYLDEDGDDVLDTGEKFAFYLQQETTPDTITGVTGDDSLTLVTFNISYTE